MARHVLSWMDDRVGGNTLRGMLDAVRRQGAPQWIGTLPEDDGDRETALQDRLSTLVDGHAEDEAADAMMASLADWTRDGRPVTVDPTAVLLARRTGTDMMAALAVCRLFDEWVPGAWWFNVVQGPAKREKVGITRPGADLSIDAPLARGALWCENGIVLDRVFPETIVHALPGRRLEQMLSHPDIDPLGLVIKGIERVSANQSRILTSYRAEHRPLSGFTRAELAADHSLMTRQGSAPKRGAVDTTPHF